MALGLKLCVYICLLGLSTKPSILVQPSEVQNTSFKFTLSKHTHLKIYIKLYMHLWLQLNNWPMQLMHLSMLRPGGGKWWGFDIFLKKLSKSTPQGHHHWSKNGNTPYVSKSIFGQKTVIFPPSAWGLGKFVILHS